VRAEKREGRNALGVLRRRVAMWAQSSSTGEMRLCLSLSWLVRVLRRLEGIRNDAQWQQKETNGRNQTYLARGQPCLFEVDNSPKP